MSVRMNAPLRHPCSPSIRVGWLYTRLSAVSAGCITAQTQRPLNVDEMRYVQKELGLPAMRRKGLYTDVSSFRRFTRYVLAQLYAGSCTVLPMAVRRMAASIPRASPPSPSSLTMLRKPSNVFLYLYDVFPI